MEKINFFDESGSSSLELAVVAVFYMSWKLVMIHPHMCLCHYRMIECPHQKFTKVDFRSDKIILFSPHIAKLTHVSVIRRT